MKYKNHTLKGYLDVLSARVPVPGGGSAAALVGALGTALLVMVANYSKGKSKLRPVNKRIDDIVVKGEKLKKRFLELVDLDAQAYLGVVKTRHASDKVRKQALKKAGDVPLETCRLCYAAIDMAPFLVKNGNRHLLSDVQVAVEMLQAAFNSSMINVEINQ